MFGIGNLLGKVVGGIFGDTAGKVVSAVANPAGTVASLASKGTINF